MKFINLFESQRKGKRFVAIFENPKKTIHFGSKRGSTYIDHHDTVKKENYLKRHKVNEDWTEVNAGSLSAFLLWGPTPDLESNLIWYLNHFDL